MHAFALTSLLLYKWFWAFGFRRGLCLFTPLGLHFRSWWFGELLCQASAVSLHQRYLAVRLVLHLAGSARASRYVLFLRDLFVFLRSLWCYMPMVFAGV